MMTTHLHKNDQAVSGTTLLTSEEHAACQQIAAREAPHSQRAAALLALHDNNTQARAAEKAGLSIGQVKYWLYKFRKQHLSIFPSSLLEISDTPPEGEPATERKGAAESAAGTPESTAQKSQQPLGRKWSDAKLKTRKSKAKKKAKKKKAKAKKTKKQKPSGKAKKSNPKAGVVKKKKKGKKGRKPSIK
jgi:hypothetical protein